MTAEEAGDMSMPSSAKEEETEEDDEEPQDLTKNMKTDVHLPAMRKVRHAISGRGITLAMLMNEGIIEPGDSVMSIEYLVCYSFLGMVL